ncbi:hypothetical protein [Pseudoduganella violacea]|uniref:Uncharacterized protein n=1 Tax=Pseudoduganella violacea TaxID=1715466 RepID=A0A7W5BEC4_9BURK|nr:hypothetical protein [Pseudoduganella violacea]MBB3121636.1 hypothetical protein [Pseudoduganella violacea]
MPEIRLDIPQSVIDSINDKLNKINDNPPGTRLSANDIGREAIAVYKWVIDQSNDGLAIVAAGADSKPVVQITTPNLPVRRPRM